MTTTNNNKKTDLKCIFQEEWLTDKTFGTWIAKFKEFTNSSLHIVFERH